VKTYILRIYRYKKGKPHNLVGLVEEVGAKGSRGFTNLEELWEILSSPTSQHSSLQATRESRKKVFKNTDRDKGGDKILEV
jgi:hypothetical protein